MIVLINETVTNIDTIPDLIEYTVFCNRKSLFKLPNKYIVKIYNTHYEVSMQGVMRTLLRVKCAEIKICSLQIVM